MNENLEEIKEELKGFEEPKVEREKQEEDDIEN